MSSGLGGTPRPVEQVLALGEELLRLLQPPVNDETLDRLEALTAERERSLKLALEAAASDPAANGPDPETLRQLVAQQRALEAQSRRVMTSMQDTSGEMHVARSSMEAVNRILNPGVRSRWFDERR